MLFNGNLFFGFGSIPGGNVNSICITTIGTDGTWFGYESGSFGAASPGAAVDGTDLFSFKWKADGTFIISFGVAGATLIVNLNYMIIRHNSIPDANIAHEDVTDYTYTDATLAGILTLLDETCFDVVFVPTMPVDLAVGETLRGTKV